MEGALTALTQEGIVGALLVVTLGAIAYLVKANAALQKEFRDYLQSNNKDQTAAMINMANALTGVSKALDDNTQVLRGLSAKGGG